MNYKILTILVIVTTLSLSLSIYSNAFAIDGNFNNQTYKKIITF